MLEKVWKSTMIFAAASGILLSSASAQTGVTLNQDSLPGFLTSLGYQPHKDPSRPTPAYRFTAKSGKYTFDVLAQVSSNNFYLYFSTELVEFPASTPVPQKSLEALLNPSAATSFFVGD